MKILKCIVVLTALLLTGASSFAQNEDPASWKYEVKKKSATQYELIFHLTLKAKWHIWSLHPGGDGMEIAPSFVFDKNAKVTLSGPVTEKGTPTVTTMEGIDGKVTYFSGTVDYIQTVTVTGNTKLKCTHTYQVCNDMMCLPPKDKIFVFDIK
ncbi:MAG: sugar transporter [Flavipsychrobacter sp.]|nr:sugar transporter [Flavipsychrobacter sp.]